MSDFYGLYNIRDMKQEDTSFILATFLRGLYHGDSWFSLIPRPIFMDNYKKIANMILTSPTTIVKVACLKEDPDVILGYCMLSDDLQAVHWVYVKAAWRKQGIAKALLPKFPTTTTHLSALGKSLMSKIPNIVFNPFYQRR